MNIKKNTLILLVLCFAGSVWSKELPSWGMTETQFKMPNFVTKMNKIGDQAVANSWLLKITAPKDWHQKIRAALSQQGDKNVQINFKDSLYKSITITATPGMELKTTTSQSSEPAVVRKQVVIDKPDMDTEIEAPEFDNNFKTDDILEDIGQMELELPKNGHTKQPSNKTDVIDKAGHSEASKTNAHPSQSVAKVSEEESKASKKENLRIRYARGKGVERSINYANITSDDDLFVDGEVVLVKRYVNRGVAIYYWMAEDYDSTQHAFTHKGSGRYEKSDEAETTASQPVQEETRPDSNSDSARNPNNDFFDFVAVSDNRDIQDQMRREFIRNKAVTMTIKASQLKSDDILYVSEKTVLVERPLGNAHTAYFWLEGDTNIQQDIEKKGPQKFVIQ